MTWKYSEPIKTSVYFLITQRVSSDHFKKKKDDQPKGKMTNKPLLGAPKTVPPSQPVPAIRVCLSLQGLKGTDFCFPGLTCPYDMGAWPALANRVWQKKSAEGFQKSFLFQAEMMYINKLTSFFFTGWGHVDYWMCELGLLFFFTFHIQLLHKSFQLYLQNMLRITSFSKSSLTWLLAIFS